MKIIDAYQAARDMATTALHQARTATFRGLFYLEFDRQQHEDDALAALRALGDNGTHLYQAVALALAGVEDEDVERFLRRQGLRNASGPDVCPTCRGAAHRDMAGDYWTTAASEAEDALQRVRDELSTWSDAPEGSVMPVHGAADLIHAALNGPEGDALAEAAS